MTSPTRALQSGLRRRALELKTERSRGHIPLKVWAGDLRAGTSSESVTHFDPSGQALDDGDRAEIALALANAVRAHVPEPVCWITRSGSPDLCPTDLAWLAAADRSWQELGLTLSFFVVTREGWVHHPSGVERHWTRLRDRV